jgi:hypothetical protein
MSGVAEGTLPDLPGKVLHLALYYFCELARAPEAEGARIKGGSETSKVISYQLRPS